MPTGLEDVLLDAVRDSRDVVIAGSAGGGKTHLAHVLSGEFQVHTWDPGVDLPEDDHVLFVPDTTAVQPEDRSALFGHRNQDTRSVVIAINEGPLHALARAVPDTEFAKTRDFLHEAQNGIKSEPDSSSPVLIDVGGFDVLSERVASALLNLDLLREVVDATSCSCEDPAICPRRLAWRLLEHSEVRERVGEVLRFVNIGGEPVLFRELWGFVADLATGGSCREGLPTSPWYWRVFYGSSDLSRRLRSVVDPQAVVAPRADAHLFYGDFDALAEQVLPGCDLEAPPGTPPYADEAFRWLKTQFFFVSRAASATGLLSDQFDVALFLEVGESRTEELVRAINRYVTYGASQRRQQLDLYVDMGVERRQERPSGQVALGGVNTDDLEIRRSYAVVNHPNIAVEKFGARRFLTHTASDAALLITPEKLNLLGGGRSYRVADRPHTDLEWELGRFFTKAAQAAAVPSVLKVFSIDFDSMSPTVRSHDLSVEKGFMEPSDGS